jgi:hypothetical protein
MSDGTNDPRGDAGGRVAACVLVLGLATTCGAPPAPPAGIARLIIKCCELIGGTPAAPDCRPNRALDHAAVILDGEARGTCANWRGKGAILATGRHVIQVRVPLDGALEEGECCVDAGAYLKLQSGEIITQQVGLKPFKSSSE